MSSFRSLTAKKFLLVTVAALFGSTASAFSVLTTPDLHWHLVHTAATTAAHQAHHVAQHHGTLWQNLLTAYQHQLAVHPLPTKMVTGATLAVAGDAIAQQQQSQSEPYDTTRAMSFAVFDMAYRALQHFAFPVIVAACQGQFLGELASTLLSSSSSDPQHAAAAMEQTLASQLIVVPFLYYPAFFALTGALQGLDVQSSVNRAKENFAPLMQRNLLFWIPVQFVQFGFVPTDWQIPFLSCAGLCWTFILSCIAGSAKSYDTEQDPAEQLMAVVAAAEQQDKEESAAGIAVVADAVNKQRDLVKV